jgi:K+-transporting ATPase ATPase C chain
MVQQLLIATRLLVILTVLTGGVYPAVVTGIAQLAFPHAANGSLIERTAGSELIGQPFSRPEYFWGRLSATSSVPYNAAASSGSNYGPLNPALKVAAETRLAALNDGTKVAKVPVDLVTASGSGLDPHISPAAAEIQIPRAAAARSLQESVVRDVVRQHTQSRQFGVLGEPRVNVLMLNLALDRLRSER